MVKWSDRRLWLCEVPGCANRAEVTHPDGQGEQVKVCGEHDQPGLFPNDDERTNDEGA